MADQFTAEEVAKLRLMMERLTFVEGGDEGDGSGGDVTLQPGIAAEGGRHGRIFMENPGGVARPFVTVRDGEGELDVYLGSEGPRSTESRMPADVPSGSLYLEYGGRGPVKIHRRLDGEWVWMRWS
jgi:hypothetical protein